MSVIHLSLCPSPLSRCYVLACQAYVSLGLGDPVTSLASSRELLATPLLSGGLRFLGQVYSAEALVLLGRVTEAMTHLSPESVVNISVSSPRPGRYTDSTVISGRTVPSHPSLYTVPKDTDSEPPVHQATHPPNAGNQSLPVTEQP